MQKALATQAQASYNANTQANNACNTKQQAYAAKQANKMLANVQNARYNTQTHTRGNYYAT